ncbi:DUF3604 domain-containing protein [Candidatus Poribacteria bacterium]|nr:DUF3604 domain-containing protein [Candidatus Poribacteria bacterium]
MPYQLYWGDIHNHCGISYGHGKLEDALVRAREQLDFCSVTGHAFWPDIPTDRAKYERIINFHTEGFQKLAKSWQNILKAFQKYNDPGNFLTFISYEWHSCEFGDHCVYYPDDRGELITADTIQELRNKIKTHSGMVIPHHIGYPRGYRGMNWDSFDEGMSPFVEIYSMHGCSESDNAPYPMLHTMGPRDYQSTAEFGYKQGRKFGLVASTDHHSAYPGSWGDGRMAVYARELTRESVWDAFLNRRTYAVTGDKIKADISVNDAILGQTITQTGKREINLNVETCDFPDRVEVLKNGKVIKCLTGFESKLPEEKEIRAKVRIEWGWGRKENEIRWDGQLSVSEGSILSVETCFSGLPILAPQDREVKEKSLPHKLIFADDKSCKWYSHTTGNVTMKHQTTQAIIVEVEMPLKSSIEINVNGNYYKHTLEELAEGSRSHFIRGLLTEAIRIHRAVPFDCYTIHNSFTDESPEKEVDYYQLRVSQVNNQRAWLTPVWVQS